MQTHIYIIYNTIDLYIHTPPKKNSLKVRPRHLGLNQLLVSVGVLWSASIGGCLVDQKCQALRGQTPAKDVFFFVENLHHNNGITTRLF